MSTRIRGTATLSVNYWTEEDFDAEEVEQEFNMALDEVLNNNSEYGSADYDQDHDYECSEEESESW